MKKIIICMFGLMIAAAINVAAAAETSYAINYANDTVSISGTVDVTEGNEATVALHVLNPGKTYENSDANSFENVAYAEQTDTVDGVYSFDFKLTDSGMYTAYVGSGAEQSSKLDINFVNHTENSNAIKNLNNAVLVSYDEYLRVFGIEQHSLGFDNLPLYSEVTQEVVKKRLYDEIVKKPLNPENGNEAVNLFESITVQVGLNENKVANIGLYDDVMSIKTGEMKNWYANPIVTDVVKTGVTERISGKSIDSMDKFNKLFKEAMILEIVENPSVAANVKLILCDFAGDIGIVAGGAGDTIFLQLAGNNYADYAALRAAFNAANAVAVIPGNGGAPSGGGGGGGGSRVSVPNPSEVQLPPVIHKNFNDIENVSWAKEAILALADRNIVSYNAEQKFLPDNMITREEFVKLLVTLFGLESNGSEIPFTDVNTSDWFYPYISAAYQNGLCRGVTETEFGAGQPVKRQDIAVLVLRAMEAQGKKLDYLRDPLTFTDSNNIDSYALESINILNSAKILNGNDKGEFLPKNSATRAEAAVIIYGLVKYNE
ncbi:MAG: S-layer homology domain-containing protein [Clostridia bacterium]|nr:S-layer homology domain-containing protein [Clostridia bacterium]